MILVLSILASLNTVAVMQLLARRHRVGWLLSLGGQGLWVYLDIRLRAWGLLILAGVMVYTAIQGWREWRQS